MKSQLTLGPLLFYWSSDKRRDFYARIADEAPIDIVYLGEVICSKRMPFIQDDLLFIKERLEAAGKKVILSTLAFVAEKREIKSIEEACKAGFLIEANDVSCLNVLRGQDHIIGPLLNIFNEDSCDTVIRDGAIRIVLPPEVSAEKIELLASYRKNIDFEVCVFGRQVLSIALRCYHARSVGSHKDNCKFVCEKPHDGLLVKTLANESFGVINGTSVMSHGYLAAFEHFDNFQKAGITYFRLSPQDIDMVFVAQLARDVLDGKCDPSTAQKKLLSIMGQTPIINGYLNNKAGRENVSF